MSESELKPCPHCGLIDEDGEPNPMPRLIPSGIYHYVRCDACGTTSDMIAGSKSRENSIEGWNKRTPDPAAVRDQALREAVKELTEQAERFEDASAAREWFEAADAISSLISSPKEKSGPAVDLVTASLRIELDSEPTVEEAFDQGWLAPLRAVMDEAKIKRAYAMEMSGAAFLRPLRAIFGERILDQANRLKMGCADISMIETGKKEPPPMFVETLRDRYRLPWGTLLPPASLAERGAEQDHSDDR